MSPKLPATLQTLPRLHIGPAACRTLTADFLQHRAARAPPVALISALTSSTADSNKEHCMILLILLHCCSSRSTHKPHLSYTHYQPPTQQQCALSAAYKLSFRFSSFL